MEFIGLSPEQLAFLRQWFEQSNAQPDPSSKIRKPPKSVEAEPARKTGAPSSGGRSAPSSTRPSRAWILWLLLAAALAAVLWWRWNIGWQEIESGPASQTSAADPQAQSPAPIPVSAQIMEKLLIHRVEPVYPEAARPQKLDAVVVIEIVIGRDGSVLRLTPVSGPELLTHAAIDALRWWRFQPYQINGQPVPVETQVAVEFHP
jgi:TonB family protein